MKETYLQQLHTVINELNKMNKKIFSKTVKQSLIFLILITIFLNILRSMYQTIETMHFTTDLVSNLF